MILLNVIGVIYLLICIYTIKSIKIDKYGDAYFRVSLLFIITILFMALVYGINK